MISMKPLDFYLNLRAAGFGEKKAMGIAMAFARAAQLEELGGGDSFAPALMSAGLTQEQAEIIAQWFAKIRGKTEAYEIAKIS